jgi:puromycin-sensitive aminopeptidase
VMSGFVDQPGVPFVDAAVRCAGERGTASITQEGRPSAGVKASGRPGAWTIPVCVKAPGGKIACDLTGPRASSIPFDSCPAWVMANAGARGYYRVVNPPAMVAALAKDVGSLDPAERIALLSDEWALVRAGRHDVGTFLDLAGGFKAERTAAVMSTLVATLGTIDEELTTDATRAKYHEWVAQLLRPALDDIGWTAARGEDDTRRELRASLVTALGSTARDPNDISRARELVLTELAKPGSVEATLLNAAVPVAALSGDAALYEKYLARSREAADTEEQHRYMFALADFSDPALVRRTFDDVLGPDVRNQDAKIFVADLIRNHDAQSLAWQLLQARWDALQKKTGAFVGNTVIVGALGAMCGTRTLAEVKQFFATHKVPDAERTLQQAEERIQACSTLFAAQSGKLAQWLNRR